MKELPARLTYLLYFVYCRFLILVISRFGFVGRIWVLIANVPGHCLIVAFTRYIQNSNTLVLNDRDDCNENCLYI